jgi:AcrR family transcriptional regulator
MSPRIAPERRREEILDAALRCFMRTGYRGTTMDDVVNESGLSKGTIYWYFANKQELFVTLFDKIITSFLTELHFEPASDERSISDQLRQFITATTQIAEQNKGALKLPLNFIVELWQEEIFMQHYRATLQSFVDQAKALLETGIARGEFHAVDTDELAWGLAALYDGLILYYMLGLPGNIFIQVKLLSDLLIRGLAKTEDYGGSS